MMGRTLEQILADADPEVRAEAERLANEILADIERRKRSETEIAENGKQEEEQE